MLLAAQESRGSVRDGKFSRRERFLALLVVAFVDWDLRGLGVGEGLGVIFILDRGVQDDPAVATE